ncbi:sulfite exporter TauE/SafE family protein [Aestuariibacter sp. GS-14]|uniref:sulfite exporter TauE/SafE family protein n=1 Tax=Aestuariibacter sp. GS-14 TaxID=2590670 RepID=UPI00112D666D|nr:sulfite exporter TauE/SafE family protein [Aestuariibacter sp. GS-14]TPV58488.1 sulfite exporter TauE/SafE family protein [Aestuariibacter sp. GS-14]
MLTVLFGALVIGLSLGILGSGGSILTVPLLTYVVGRPPKVAIAESLLIVGCIAAVGAWKLHRQGLIAWRKVWWFGLPSMAGTYLGAWGSQFVSGAAQLATFALVMLLASGFMLRPYQPAVSADVRLAKLVLAAAGVGIVAGFVGVGGGFLIVPALLATAGVSMRQAIGTSLAVIVMQSLTGFTKHSWLFAQSGVLPYDWLMIALVAGLGAAGSLAGAQLAGKLPQQHLKRGFGVLLVVMGAAILFSTWNRL